MKYDDVRVKELVMEIETATSEETKEIAKELAQIATEALDASKDTEDLAYAVLAFADWQNERGKDKPSDAITSVGNTLWHQVSERVYAITGSTPPCLVFGTKKPYSH